MKSPNRGLAILAVLSLKPSPPGVLAAASFSKDRALTYRLPVERRNEMAARHKKRGTGKGRRKLQDDVDSYDGIFRQEHQDDLESPWNLHTAARRHTHYSKKRSCGKGYTCEPSHRPSVSPSSFPTFSFMPSLAPTDLPSPWPTVSPSDVPSEAPTVSIRPSDQPTPAPSPSPSDQPSNRPTGSPSSMPSLAPSESKLPSSNPSMSPSKSPTRTPSSVPSLSPSDSPTSTLYETNVSDGGLISTCTETPLQPPLTTENQTLTFLYNLYLTPEGVEADAVDIMERIIHFGLLEEFLDCDVQRTINDFAVVSVFSMPPDELAGGPCDTSTDPVPNITTKCAVVQAELTLEVYFGSQSRRYLQDDNMLARSEVKQSIGQFLDNFLGGLAFVTRDIVQVVFQGFVNSSESGGSQTPAPSESQNGVAGVIDGINEQPSSNRLENNFSVRGVAIGVAALLLGVLLILVGRRRRNRGEAYVKELDDFSDSEFDLNHESPREILADGKVELVYGGRNSTLGSNSCEDILQEMDSFGQEHTDVHWCASATCSICRQREIRPAFIQAPPSGYSTADLQHLPPIREARKAYGSPDTLNL